MSGAQLKKDKYQQRLSSISPAVSEAAHDQLSSQWKKIPTMPLDPSHPDYWTQALQFTETIHRDLYPAVDPTQPNLQHVAQGKVILVTGAGSGFGEVRPNPPSDIASLQF